MDGIRRHGVALFMGKLPHRKQHCFYFEKDGVVYPVAYVSEKNLEDTGRLWCEMLEGLPYKQEVK